MVKIEAIAHTTEIQERNPEKLNEEQTVLSGKFAGTCYAKEGYETIKTQPLEKALKRAEMTAKSGHHSVFQHGVINMEIICPKMIAMLCAIVIHEVLLINDRPSLISWVGIAFTPTNTRLAFFIFVG